jgi:hypothetical protein
MFRPSVAALTLALFVLPASAGIQLIETRGGKIYEATDVVVVGDKVRMALALKAGQSAVVAVPIETIRPEHVYYAWASQVADADVDGHMKLAAWCRTQGLFRQAWRQYVAASEASEEIEQRLPAIEKEMGEEAATWKFRRAEKLLKDGDVNGARVLAEQVLADYPESKEVPRTKGLLTLIGEREKFLSEQKLAEQRAALTKRQRRYVEKQLEQIDKSKLTIRNTRMKYVQDSRRRLYWASYRIRRAVHNLDDAVPFVRDDDLRRVIEAIVKDAEKHMVASFTRLADLRYLAGDVPGALDAAHEVLWIDPDNKAMTDMRKRVLDASEWRGYRYRYGYYDRYVLRRCGYLPPFATPYSVRYGYGIRCAVPYRVRPQRIVSGGLSIVRYVR